MSGICGFVAADDVMKNINQKKYDLNLTDMIILTYLFERPMFGALLLGQVAEEPMGARWFPMAEGMKSLRRLCEIGFVDRFPHGGAPAKKFDSAPGPLFGPFYSIKGSGKENLLKALAEDRWFRKEPELMELWTLMTARLGVQNFDKIVRRASLKTKLVWRKIGINYLKNSSNPFRGPLIFAET